MAGQFEDTRKALETRELKMPDKIFKYWCHIKLQMPDNLLIYNITVEALDETKMAGKILYTRYVKYKYKIRSKTS